MESARVLASTIESRRLRAAPNRVSRSTARLTPGVALVWSVAMLLVCAGAVSAHDIDPNLWVTNGTVHSIARSGVTLYIGGNFTQVGPATGAFVVIDTNTGAAQTPFPMVTGNVMAVAPDGDGGWYIGGDFSAVQGQPRGGLAHIDAGGNLTAWNPDTGGAVRALAVNAGTIYVGGYFTQIAGESRSCIGAIDAATGVVTPWNPNASNAGEYLPVVDGLAVDGGTVYACGEFTSIGGQPRTTVAAIDAATGAATSWNPNPSFAPPASARVRALAVEDGVVYAGGAFTSIGGRPRNFVAALDTATGAATTWNPNAEEVVLSLAVSKGTVYAGGFFTAIGGQLRNRIAALDATTGSATSWNPDANDQVHALAVSEGTVYAAGTFSSIGGQPRNLVAALDAATGAANSWNPNPNRWVYALAVGGGTVGVGGWFTSLGGQPRNGIAAIDAVTGVATSWNPNVSGPGIEPAFVYKLAVSGGIVYAGGQFTSVGGEPRNSIAAIDAETGIVTSWDPNANGYAGVIDDLVVSGDRVFVGGEFSNIGGQPRNSIAALDTETGLASSWNPNTDGTVYALAVNGATVYAAGQFSSMGGQPRNSIAAVDTATGAATDWNPNPNLDVFEMAVNGGLVYVAGNFTAIGGQPRRRLAALDAVTGVATSWNPNMNAAVVALAVDGETVYAGGPFTTIGGQHRKYIAAIDATTGIPLDWYPEVMGVVQVFSVSGDRVYIGGGFRSVGPWPRSGLAAVSRPATLDVEHVARHQRIRVSASPNPFSGHSTMRFSLAGPADVDLGVYDLNGRLVRRLKQGRFEAGLHLFDWDGSDGRGHEVAHGVYFVKLDAGASRMTTKIVKLQ